MIRRRLSVGALALIIAVMVGTIQLAGFINSGINHSKNATKLGTLTAQLAAAKAQTSAAKSEAELNAAKIAALHAFSIRLAHEKHVTPHQLRRLQRQTAPQVVPGPTVTVTTTAPPPKSGKPTPGHKPKHHKKPTPRCTIGPATLKTCPTIPPLTPIH